MCVLFIFFLGGGGGGGVKVRSKLALTLHFTDVDVPFLAVS